MYLAKECTHREFYTQFVNDSTKRDVLNRISIVRLKETECEHLNDIPLTEWDSIGLSLSLAASFESVGDHWSLAGLVCIGKEAARQLIESNYKI